MTRLDEIRERERKATHAPWETTRKRGYFVVSHAIGKKVIFYGGATENRNFIANSRQDIPYLLSLVEEARELIQQGVEPDAGWDSLEPALNWLQKVNQ